MSGLGRLDGSWDLLLLFFLFILLCVFDLVQYTYVWYEPAVLYQEFIFSLIHAKYLSSLCGFYGTLKYLFLKSPDIGQRKYAFKTE